MEKRLSKTFSRTLRPAPPQSEFHTVQVNNVFLYKYILWTDDASKKLRPFAVRRRCQNLGGGIGEHRQSFRARTDKNTGILAAASTPPSLGFEMSWPAGVRPKPGYTTDTVLFLNRPGPNKYYHGIMSTLKYTMIHNNKIVIA